MKQQLPPVCPTRAAGSCRARRTAGGEEGTNSEGSPGLEEMEGEREGQREGEREGEREREVETHCLGPARLGATRSTTKLGPYRTYP